MILVDKVKRRPSGQEANGVALLSEAAGKFFEVHASKWAASEVSSVGKTLVASYGRCKR